MNTVALYEWDVPTRLNTFTGILTWEKVSVSFGFLFSLSLSLSLASKGEFFLSNETAEMVDGSGMRVWTLLIKWNSPAIVWEFHRSLSLSLSPKRGRTSQWHRRKMSGVRYLMHVRRYTTIMQHARVRKKGRLGIRTEKQNRWENAKNASERKCTVGRRMFESFSNKLHISRILCKFVLLELV